MPGHSEMTKNAHTGPVGLYVHLPFCQRKCRYCDFASFAGLEARIDPYIDAVLEELDPFRSALAGRKVVTLFFGGGTPTLLSVDQLARLLDGIRARADVTTDAEITLEGNPGTVTPEALRRLRALGFNRLSLGAQSFDNSYLRALGRIHTASQIVSGALAARDAGFDNLSLDLMYGLPGQTEADWERTLESALTLPIAHLSCYSLIPEPGTPLYNDLLNGKIALPDDDCVIRMQRYATARLREAGLERYEISNYARPGRACRHNLIYWRRGDYLGLGVGAHSFFDNERFENARGFEAYLQGARHLNRTQLSRTDEMEETLMLSTRLCEGLDLRAWREAFGAPFEAGRLSAIERLEKGGFIERTGTRLRLTESGMEVQNAVLGELL